MRIVTIEDGCGFLAREEKLGPEWVSLCTKLDGWFEGAEARIESVPRLGDGGFPSVLWRDQRKLTVAFHEALGSRGDVVARAREVSAVFRSGRVGGGVITVDDERLGKVQALGVALESRPKVIHDERNLSVRWELALICPDPHLYGPVQSGQIHSAGVGIGLVYALFDDDSAAMTGVLEFGGTRQAELPLTNEGNATAYPVFAVRGNFPQGFALVLDGRRVAYGEPCVARFPVVVDMSGSVLVSGVERSQALTERQWTGVEPGRTVSPELVALGEGEGSADVEFRSCYL